MMQWIFKLLRLSAAWPWMTANNLGKPRGLWEFLGVEKGKHSLGPEESRGAYRATSSAWAAGGSGNQFPIGLFYYRIRWLTSFEIVAWIWGDTICSSQLNCSLTDRLPSRARREVCLGSWHCLASQAGDWEVEMSEEVFFRGWNGSSLRMVSYQMGGMHCGYPGPGLIKKPKQLFES